MVKVCAITVDIKGSRKLPDIQREKLHFAILKVIEKIKQAFPNDVQAAGMTTGDEFQIVIKNPPTAIDIYNLIKTQLPAKCYFGVGYGDITSFKTKNPSEMYGQAFYLSREAIETAKKKKQNEIIFKLGNETLDRELNILFELTAFIERKQTPRQKQLITKIGPEKMTLQKDLAANLGVTGQAISKSLKNSGFATILEANQFAQFLLKAKLE